MVFRAPLYVRAFFVLLCVGGAAAFLGKFLTAGEPVFLVFLPVCIPGVLEGVRGRVEVDAGRGTITSVRAVRTSRCTIDDVASIWVPAWGPVGLVLGAREAGNSSIRPRTLVTPLYADKYTAERVYRFAALLNVPLASAWQNIRWNPDSESGPTSDSVEG